MDGAVLLHDLRPGMRDISCRMIVLVKNEANMTSRGKIFTLLVADHTCSINFSVFDEFGEAIKPGDILHLSAGYCNLFRAGPLTLYTSKEGSLSRIGEFTMVFKEQPNMSQYQWALDNHKWTVFPGQNQRNVTVVPNVNGTGFISIYPPGGVLPPQQQQQQQQQQLIQLVQQQQQQQQQHQQHSSRGPHRQTSNEDGNNSTGGRRPSVQGTNNNNNNNNNNNKINRSKNQKK